MAEICFSDGSGENIQENVAFIFHRLPSLYSWLPLFFIGCLYFSSVYVCYYQLPSLYFLWLRRSNPVFLLIRAIFKEIFRDLPYQDLPINFLCISFVGPFLSPLCLSEPNLPDCVGTALSQTLNVQPRSVWILCPVCPDP